MNHFVFLNCWWGGRLRGSNCQGPKDFSLTAATNICWRYPSTTRRFNIWLLDTLKERSPSVTSGLLLGRFSDLINKYIPCVDVLFLTNLLHMITGEADLDWCRAPPGGSSRAWRKLGCLQFRTPTKTIMWKDHGRIFTYRLWFEIL